MPRRFDADSVIAMPTVGAPSVAPDGSRVAYVRSELDAPSLEQRSWIEELPFAGGEARRLTGGPGDGAPAWSPDGAALAFLRRDGERRAQPWLLPAAGGEARALAELERGGRSLAWSPDGRFLVAVTDVDPEPAEPDGVRVARQLYYRGDTLGWRGATRRQLVRIELASGAVRRLTRGDFDHDAPAVSPDGRWIAVASDRSARRELREPWGRELCVLPAAGGRVRRLVRAAWGVTGLAWSPDGRRIAFVDLDEETRWQSRVRVVEVASGRVRTLTDDALLPAHGFFPLQEAPPLVWLPGRRGVGRGAELAFAADRRGASALYAVPAAGGEARLLAGGRGSLGALSVAADGRRAAALAGSGARPTEVVALDLAGGPRGPRRLSAAATRYLATHPPSTPRRLRLRRGGLAIEGWLTLPPAGARRPRVGHPLVLDVHGGPMAHWGERFAPMQQALVGAGFAVLAVNPRGSTSYGLDFLRRVLGDWGGEDAADLLAAVDAAGRRPEIDASRLGVHGYSYGGYMAAWLTAHDERFGAAVVGGGVTNLLSIYGQTDIPVSFGELQWGGRPAERHEWLAERSPLTHADRVTAPTLLLHGEEDVRAPISQSEELFAALRRRRVPTELVRFPGCSHLFLRTGPPALRRAYVQRTIEWLRRYL